MVRLGLVVATVLALESIPSVAQTVPLLLPPRPKELSPSAPPPTPPAATLRSPSQGENPAQSATGLDLSLAQLKAAGFDVEAAEQPSSANELCRIASPVRLKAVPVRSRPGAMIRLNAQPLLACRFADSFERWVGDLVSPMVTGSLDTELTNV